MPRCGSTTRGDGRGRVDVRPNAAAATWLLVAVLETDRLELDPRVRDGGDGDDGAARECLAWNLEDAVEDLRARPLTAVAQFFEGQTHRGRVRE